jgi:hypothetical protein
MAGVRGGLAGLVQAVRDHRPPTGHATARPRHHAIIEAFASGRSLSELVAAGKAAESDEYMQRQEHGGPASFTSAVLMRLLKPARAGGSLRRRGGPPQPDAGVDPFAKHDAKGAP